MLSLELCGPVFYLSIGPAHPEWSVLSLIEPWSLDCNYCVTAVCGWNARFGVEVAADCDLNGVIVAFDILQGDFGIASCLQPENEVGLSISWLAQTVVVQELVDAVVFREDHDGGGVTLTVRVNSKYWKFIKWFCVKINESFIKLLLIKSIIRLSLI